MEKLKPLFIGGPCVIESYESCLLIAETMQTLCDELGFEYVFKSSFDKANRSSLSSYRGPGIYEGIEIFKSLKSKLNIQITTDVHESTQVDLISDYVDIIQIPAFLCRQTDLVLSAAKTQKRINIKKSQMMSPNDMVNILEKIRTVNNEVVFFSERGTCFGYNNLVLDLRSLLIMNEMNVRVVIDGTHAAQQPGSLGKETGGDSSLVNSYFKAAASLGINCFFAEIHEKPELALSDSKVMLSLSDMPKILEEIKSIINVVKNF